MLNYVNGIMVSHSLNLSLPYEQKNVGYTNIFNGRCAFGADICSDPHD